MSRTDQRKRKTSAKEVQNNYSADVWISKVTLNIKVTKKIELAPHVLTAYLDWDFPSEYEQPL